jgi:hypothetical protein
MEAQQSLLASIAPSLIAAIALVTAALLTYLLTTRLEHRKWLRQERLRAYEGYIACLRTAIVVAKEPDKTAKKYPNSLIADLTEQTDRLLLFCSEDARSLVRKHGKMLGEWDQSTIAEGLSAAVREFQKQARRDLGTNRRTH